MSQSTSPYAAAVYLHLRWSLRCQLAVLGTGAQQVGGAGCCALTPVHGVDEFSRVAVILSDGPRISAAYFARKQALQGGRETTVSGLCGSAPGPVADAVDLSGPLSVNAATAW